MISLHIHMPEVPLKYASENHFAWEYALRHSVARTLKGLRTLNVCIEKDSGAHSSRRDLLTIKTGPIVELSVLALQVVNVTIYRDYKKDAGFWSDQILRRGERQLQATLLDEDGAKKKQEELDEEEEIRIQAGKFLQ